MTNDEMIELHDKLRREMVGGYGTEIRQPAPHDYQVVRDRADMRVSYSLGKNFPWTFRFKLGQEEIKTDKVPRKCRTCGRTFYLDTYHGIVDDDYSLPCVVPAEVLDELRRSFRGVRKCELHSRAAQAIMVRRTQTVVFWMANVLRKLGVVIVKGKAGVGEMDWFTLFNRRFSFLKRPAVADVMPWEEAELDWTTFHPKVLEDAYGIVRADDETRAEVRLTDAELEHIDAEDTEGFYQTLAEIEDYEDAPASRTHRTQSDVELAQQICRQGKYARRVSVLARRNLQKLIRKPEAEIRKYYASGEADLEAM